jgi:hypothetical protein
MAIPKIYTYNSKDVVVLIGGLEVESGWGSDSKVNITRSNALSEGVSGVDGDTMINFFNNTMGRAELTFMYGSEWDVAFDQIASQNLPIPFAVYHKKSNKVLVTIAWVEEQPDTSMGSSAEDRTWALGLQNADFSLAQNAEATIAGYKFFTDY